MQEWGCGSIVECTPSTGQDWGGTLATPEPGRWKQEDSEFRARLCRGSVSKIKRLTECVVLLFEGSKFGSQPLYEAANNYL